MKKEIVRLMLAALTFIATPGLAQNGVDYANVQLAIIDATGFDSGLAAVVTVGEQLPVQGIRLAVEGEFSKSLLAPEHQLTFADLSYFSLAGYGVVTVPMGPQAELRARAGLRYLDAEVERAGSDDDFRLTAGIGAVFRLTSQSNIVAGFTILDPDINHLSAGMQFRF